MARIEACIEDEWVECEIVGYGSASGLLEVEYIRLPDPDPDPEPDDSDIGTPGNRPTVASRPDENTTGPRVSTTQTMSGPQAMLTILNAPVESDGKRYLRRTLITSNLNLQNTGANALVFEDCVIDAGQGSIYAISAFYQEGLVEPTTWPEFRYCSIVGGSSATIRGGWIRLLRCDLSYGTDILKPFQGMEVWASYLHDCYRRPGAHCDLIQIVNGTSGGLFHYNNFLGYTSDDSPEEPNSWVSGILQTGTINGPIGVPHPVLFIGNWLEGGRVGFRGSGGPSDNPDNHEVRYIFQYNRFIRDSFQFGPIGNMHVINDVFDSTNVWDDDSEPLVEPPDPTDGWQDAFDSRDFNGTEPVRYGDPGSPGQLLSWYQENTGHDPNLSYETLTGTLTINQTWLTANEGNGRVRREGDRWIVERYRVTGMIRLAANNVTLRNIHHDSAGSLYALQSREVDGNATGIIVENCTLAGNGASDNGATLNFPAARAVDQIIIRFCDISGYRAGIYCFGGITAEYNYVHDLHFSEGSHNTGASIRAGNVTLRRNLITDGNSSAISFYPEYGPYTGIHVEENALRLATVDTGAEVIIANNREFSELLPGQVRRLVGNLFYRGGNRGEGGGTGSRMDLLSEVSGNFDRMGEPVN